MAKMGRPWKEEKILDTTISFGIQSDDRRDFEKAVMNNSTTVADAMRALVRNYIKISKALNT